MKTERKIRCKAILGRWLYETIHMVGRAGRRAKRFVNRHIEITAVILIVLLFIAVSWWILIITLSHLYKMIL